MSQKAALSSWFRKGITKLHVCIPKTHHRPKALQHGNATLNSSAEKQHITVLPVACALQHNGLKMLKQIKPIHCILFSVPSLILWVFVRLWRSSSKQSLDPRISRHMPRALQYTTKLLAAQVPATASSMTGLGHQLWLQKTCWKWSVIEVCLFSSACLLKLRLGANVFVGYMFEPTGWKPSERFRHFYICSLGWGGVWWGNNAHVLAHSHDVTPRHVHLHVRTYVMLRWRCVTSRRGGVGWGLVG